MYPRKGILIALIVFSGSVGAQDTAPRPSDQFAPAASRTVATPDNAKPSRAANAEESRFKFEDNRPKPLDDPYKDRRPFERAGSPPSAQDGRPPVQCAQTPNDPACR